MATLDRPVVASGSGTLEAAGHRRTDWTGNIYRTKVYQHYQAKAADLNEEGKTGWAKVEQIKSVVAQAFTWITGILAWIVTLPVDFVSGKLADRAEALDAHKQLIAERAKLNPPGVESSITAEQLTHREEEHIEDAPEFFNSELFNEVDAPEFFNSELFNEVDAPEFFNPELFNEVDAPELFNELPKREEEISSTRAYLTTAGKVLGRVAVIGGGIYGLYSYLYGGSQPVEADSYPNGTRFVNGTLTAPNGTQYRSTDSEKPKPGFTPIREEATQSRPIPVVIDPIHGGTLTGEPRLFREPLTMPILFPQG